VTLVLPFKKMPPYYFFKLLHGISGILGNNFLSKQMFILPPGYLGAFPFSGFKKILSIGARRMIYSVPII